MKVWKEQRLVVMLPHEDLIFKTLEGESSLEEDLENVKRIPLPKNINPMLARVSDLPFDNWSWLYEIKWDGWRTIAQINDNEALLYSRNHKVLNEKFPQISGILKKWDLNAVIDGEIVVLDGEGLPDFQMLQNWDGKGDGFLAYYVFDIVYFNAFDLSTLPLETRKELLFKILPKDEHIRFSSHIRGEGKMLFEEVQKQGLEGIIAKHTFSTYEFGKRSGSWLKIKAKKTQEAVIGGYTLPRGSRKKFGALILGVYNEFGQFEYIGHTGGGFSEESLNSVFEKLKNIKSEESPFVEKFATNMPPVWVHPNLICEVEYTEWTGDGHLRHPIFRGLRVDKDPKSIRREGYAKNTRDKPNQNFTNTNKVYFPKKGLTKGDVLNYYKQISQYILPYIMNRPHSLFRQPNGIKGKSFFQKDMNLLELPKHFETYRRNLESEKREIDYLVCNGIESLLFMVNLGCIEINPWLSTVESIEKPDFMLLDLDPLDVPFWEVIECAKVVKNILDSVGATSFLKTSGKKGLHIVVPFAKGRYSYEQSKQLSEIIAIMANQKLPKTTSIERSPSRRRGKVYLDYLQNRMGQTMAAPYCLRPVEEASISTPLMWEELDKTFLPSEFGFAEIFSRIEKYGDLWKGTISTKNDIAEFLEKLPD